MHGRQVVVIVPLLLALACSSGGENGAAPQPAPGADGNQSTQDGGGNGGDGGAAASETPDEAGNEDTVTAEPAAELKGSCTPKPKTVDGVQQLVAELELVNTGNLGVKVRVASRWPINRANGVTRWRRMRVDQGETVPVTIRLVVDETTAKGVRRGISRGRKCTVRSRVLGAYGVPEEG